MPSNLELEALKIQKSALEYKRRELNIRINEVTEQIQSLCDHSWYLEQVAGDGRTCSKCRKHEWAEE